MEVATTVLSRESLGTLDFPYIGFRGVPAMAQFFLWRSQAAMMGLPGFTDPVTESLSDLRGEVPPAVSLCLSWCDHEGEPPEAGRRMGLSQ